MKHRRLYCARDLARMECYANEVAGIGTPPGPGEPGGPDPGGGTGVDPDGNPIGSTLYWQRDISLAFDPVYMEPVKDNREVFFGPYRLIALITDFEEGEGHYDVDVAEHGVERIYDAMMILTVANWNLYVANASQPGLAKPREGDIVGAFNGERFYEIEKVEASGYLLNTNRHVEWKCLLKKRDSFTPDRHLPAVP